MRALALALVLASCAPPATIPAAAVAPDDLRFCPITPAPVPIPKPPRSFNAVVDWANATEAQRSRTVQALEVCRHKLEQLLALYEAKQ